MVINQFPAQLISARKVITLEQAVKWGPVLAGLALLWTFRVPVLDMVAIVGDRTAVITYLGKFGMAGPLLLSLILVLQVIIAAIPGHILMISGGYVYGFAAGCCLNLAATTIGSQIAFLLARWAGQPVVERLAPAELLEKWRDITAEKGLLFFLAAFMLPVFPADILNYVAGLSSLSSDRFLIANVLGRLPGVVVLTAIGAYGFTLSGWMWLAILGAAAVITIVIWRYGLARRITQKAQKC